MKRKIIRKMICIGLLSLTLLGFTSIGASAEWKQDDVEWWYANGDSYATGWNQIVGKWYWDH